MSFQTTFPMASVDVNEFRDLIQRLAKIYGKTVDIDEMIVVSTDDVGLSSVFDSLADAIQIGKPVEIVTKKVKKPRKAKGDDLTIGGVKKEPTRGPHVRSIKVLDTGEMISRFELNKRLADKIIPVGTKLRSPKYGEITVVVSGSDWVVMNDQEEVV